MGTLSNPNDFGTMERKRNRIWIEERCLVFSSEINKTHLRMRTDKQKKKTIDGHTHAIRRISV